MQAPEGAMLGILVSYLVEGRTVWIVRKGILLFPDLIEHFMFVRTESFVTSSDTHNEFELMTAIRTTEVVVHFNLHEKSHLPIF